MRSRMEKIADRFKLGIWGGGLTENKFEEPSVHLFRSITTLHSLLRVLCP